MKHHAKGASLARMLLVPTLLWGSVSMVASPVYATQVNSSQTVTLRMNKVKLSEVFEKLSNLSGCEFFYDESVVQKYNTIDINLDNVSFDQALEQIKKQTNLQLNRVNNTIVVSLARNESAASARTQLSKRKVTGVVTDVNNEPLIGVSIAIQGNSGGTITDFDGRFTLDEVDPNATLVFSYIGYITQKVTVGNQQVLNVQLKEDNQTLEEVVVIGYGVQKKRDMTGSVASIKSKDITAIPTTNALEALQGKVAGLDLTTSSGQAGSTPNFTIRGERSLTASNAPLILVDGIDYGTSLDINPTDIESIEVLKDASSTAIYGTRGANGIIMITTKKGKEGKSKVSLNAFVSSTMITDYPDIMNADEYARYKREAYRDRTTGKYADDAAVFAPEELAYMENGYDTNYRDLLMHNGFNQNYEISVSGGNTKTKHNISLGYRSEEGLFKDDDYQRFNARVALDHQLFDNVQIGTNIIYAYVDKNNRYSPLNMANKIVPISKPYDDEGNLVMYPSPGYNTQMNPLIDDQEGMRVDNTIQERFFGSLYLNWNITKDILFRTTLGLNSVNERRGFFCDKNSLQGSAKDSQSYKEHTMTRNLTWENVLTYSKDFSDIHSFQAMVGTSTIMNSKEYTYAGGKGQVYSDNWFHNLYSNEKEITIKSSLVDQNLASFFGRVNYKLMDRYMLTASLRADGSSVFAPGKKWGYFPSVALAWRINEESFLKNVEAISNLKLRLSWGESGQCAINPYQTSGLLGTSTYSFNNEVAYGFYPKTMSNKELTWETTTQYNVGLDFGFFNNRISGSIDAYKSQTRNILMDRMIPSINGYASVMENIGKTESTGVDFSLSTVNVRHKNFSWFSDFSLSHNREKIKELASGQLKDEANAWFVGKPFKVFYDYKKIGIWQSGEEAAAALNGQEPGDIKVQDTDGDGSITTDDRIIYSQRPDVTFGFNNTFNYKGFDLSVFLYARLGQWISYDYNTTYRINALENGGNVDYWTPENPTNAFPRPNKNKSYTQVTYYSTLKYEDGSFFKIRDITLGYTFQPDLLKHLKLSKLRVYATAKNFFTFSKIDNYDPEQGGSISFPMTKQLVFGLNVEF